MKEISQLENQIIKWCNENSLLYFEGKLTQESNIFSVYTENRIMDFLELGKKNDISNIVLCREYFSYVDFESSIIEKARDDDELINLIESALSNLPDYEDKLFSIIIYWAKDGVIYKSFQQAKWVSKFISKVDDLISDYKTKQREEKNKTFPYSQEKREVIIEKLARHPDYLRYSTRHTQLDAIMEEIMLNEGVELSDFNLRAAKKIVKPDAFRQFMKIYYIKSVDTLKMQIRAMTKKGFSKIDTIAKLDITEGLYHKYK